MDNKLKSTTVYKCDFISGDFNPDASAKKSHKHNYIELNINGNIVKEIYYGKEGEEESLNEFLYDEKGHLAVQRHIEEEELAEKITYKIGANGMIEKEFRHYLDGTFDTIEHVYNGQNIAQKTHTDSDEEVEQTEYFEWKEQNLLREYIKDADDEIVFEKKYTYNSDGTHLLETYLHDKLSEKESRVVNEYDEKGNKSLTKLYDNKNRLLSRTTYFVNEKNEVTQIIEEEGLNKTVIYLDYDERGNIIKEEDYSSNEILTARFEQKYNENNMLIEYTAFIDKQGEGSNQSYVLTYEYTFFE